jgi:hypothetical protein
VGSLTSHNPIGLHGLLHFTLLIIIVVDAVFITPSLRVIIASEYTKLIGLVSSTRSPCYLRNQVIHSPLCASDCRARTVDRVRPRGGARQQVAGCPTVLSNCILHKGRCFVLAYQLNRRKSSELYVRRRVCFLLCHLVPSICSDVVNLPL